MPPEEASILAPVLARESGTTTYALACIAMISAALALGLYGIGHRCIWFDEAATWVITSSNWKPAIIYMLKGEDCGGFVYAVLMKFWTGGFGFSEQALRVPSALFAGALTGVMLAIGRVTGDRRASLFCGLLTALHPTLIEYSREARAYMLEALLAAVCILGVVWFHRGGYRQGGRLLTISALLLVVTHVFGIFFVGGVLLYLLGVAGVQPGVRLGRAVRPLLPAVVVALLWGYALHARINHNLNNFWIRGTIIGNYADTVAAYLPLPWISLPLFLAGLVVLWRSEDARQRLLAGLVTATTCGVLIGPGLVSLLSRGDHNFILPRYFMPLLPLVVVPLAFLCGRLPKLVGWGAVAAVAASWLAAANFAAIYGAVGPDGDMRAAAEWLKENCRPQDRVFVIPEYQAITLAYYGVDQACAIEGASLRTFAELAQRKYSASRGRPFVVVSRTTEVTVDEATAPAQQWQVHPWSNLSVYEWILREPETVAAAPTE